MKYNSIDLHYEDFMLKIHDVTDGYRQSHLAGTNDVTETFNGGNWSMCATPALAATCKVLYYSGWYMNTFWDQANGRWILAATEGMERRVYSMVPGGNVEQISYLARNIDNGAIHINQAGVDYLYYCTGGRIYKHNLDSNTDLGVMPWPVTNMSCRGMTLDYDPTNNSIIFPFEQNGLMGVAEYFL